MTKKERYYNFESYVAGAAMTKCKECGITSGSTAMYSCKKNCPSWDRKGG